MTPSVASSFAPGTIGSIVKWPDAAQTYLLVVDDPNGPEARGHGEPTDLDANGNRIGDLTQSHDLTVSLGDHKIHEILWPLETSLQTNRALVEVPVQASNRRGEILRLECLHDLVDADSRRLQRLRIQLNRHLALDAANELNLSDAWNSAELAGDVRIGEARELRRSHHCRSERHRYDRLIGRIESLQHRLLHLDRKVGADSGDRVPNVLRADLRILLEQKQRNDLSVSIAGGAVDLVDTGDALDRVLDRLEDFALDAFR